MNATLSDCFSELQALCQSLNISSPSRTSDPVQVIVPLKDHGLVFMTYKPSEAAVFLTYRFFDAAPSPALYEALLTANLAADPVDTRLGLEMAGHCVLLEGTYRPEETGSDLAGYTQAFVNQIRRWHRYLSEHHLPEPKPSRAAVSPSHADAGRAAGLLA